MLHPKTSGRLLNIFIAPPVGPYPPPAGGYDKILPMQEIEEAEVVVDMGIRGDRWFGVKEFKLPDGTLKLFPHDRQVSLMSVEDINSLGLDVQPIALRRNLLVDIPVNTLVGKQITIGEIVLVGTGLCKACKHIEKYTVPGIISKMYDQGGLHTKVIKGGTIKQGDEICW
jgi:hypothetical protein